MQFTRLNAGHPIVGWITGPLPVSPEVISLVGESIHLLWNLLVVVREARLYYRRRVNHRDDAIVEIDNCLVNLADGLEWSHIWE